MIILPSILPIFTGHVYKIHIERVAYLILDLIYHNYHLIEMMKCYVFAGQLKFVICNQQIRQNITVFSDTILPTTLCPYPFDRLLSKTY